MPYIDTVGDVVRVTMAWFASATQLQETNMALECAVSGGTDSRPALNAHFDVICTTNIGPMIVPNAEYFGSRVSFLRTLVPFSPTVTRPETAGTAGGSALPSQDRMLVSWKTDKQGRRFRGRSYLPTPSTTFLTAGGHLTAPGSVAIKAWADAVMATFATAGTTWVPCLYHRHPTALISDVFTPITANEVTSRFATQRRSGDFGRVNVAPW